MILLCREPAYFSTSSHLAKSYIVKIEPVIYKI